MSTANTIQCSWTIEIGVYLIVHVDTEENIFPRFSRNSEANASEFIENLEKKYVLLVVNDINSWQCHNNYPHVDG